jgi:hypothetical protein
MSDRLAGLENDLLEATEAAREKIDGVFDTFEHVDVPEPPALKT